MEETDDIYSRTENQSPGNRKALFYTAVDCGPVATRQLLKCCGNNSAAEVEKVAAEENLVAAEDGVCRKCRWQQFGSWIQ